MKSLLYHIPVIGKLARVLEERNSDLVSFGENNILPKEIMEGIAAAGTATECVSLISSFIQADGFEDEKFKTRKANPSQVWGDLLPIMSDDMAIFEGTYINIQMNNEGGPEHYYILPFDEMRRGVSGNFYRKKIEPGKPHWEDKSLSKAITYPPYNPGLEPKQVLNIINEQKKANNGIQLGFVFYIHRKKVYPKWYSLGDFYAGWEDIETDAALQRLERRNVKKGFKADVIISTLGEIDNEQEDPNGKTDYDYFKENLKKFTGEEGSSILHLYGKQGDSMPTVTPFPLKDLLNGIDLARKRVSKAVCRHFKTPPILVIGEENYGWGDTKALVNSMKLFNKNVLKYQNMISDGLIKLFPGEKVNTTITTMSVADYVDPSIKDILLAREIGDEQKVEIMLHIFQLTEEVSKKLVYGPTGKPKKEDNQGAGITEEKEEEEESAD